MNNKSFSAEEISGLIQELDHNFSEYEDKADIFISHCNEFKDNDSYQGTNAVAAKIIVGEKEVEIANLQKDVHTKLLDMYKHVAQSFADKVDSASNARLDLDALTISENGLKSIYGKMDDYCCKFENIAKEMQNKYGHIGTITVPDCNPLRESMINLCGGDVDNAGFLYELKQKLIIFDEEECAYIESQSLDEELKKCNNDVAQINSSLDVIQNRNVKTKSSLFSKKTDLLKNHPKVLFNDENDEDSDDNDKTEINTEKNIFDSGKKHYIKTPQDSLEETCGITMKDIEEYKQKKNMSIIKDNYSFSDEEMIFFKDNNIELLNSLCLTMKLNSSEADKIANKLKKKWIASSKIGDDYGKKIVMPSPGELVEVSLGKNHNPPRQNAIVCYEDTWSMEYSYSSINSSFPLTEYRSSRALKYIVEELDTNFGENHCVLVANIDGYGECYVGAMVEGFGKIGDIVEVTLDNNESFNMLLCDTKSINHKQDKFEPKGDNLNWQCQNYWGHGYVTEDQTKVQICACEFFPANEITDKSAKEYDNCKSLLTGRHVVEAKIIGSIDMPD